MEEEMNDQDRARERDHWQAIAEQLGLAPEAKRAERPAEERAEIAQHIEPPAIRAEPSADADDEPAPRPSEEPVEAENRVQAGGSSPPSAKEDTDEGVVENEPERQAPRGRRKRRSDSSKSGRHSPRETPVQEKASAATSKRRDKGRGRKKQSSRVVEDKSERDQVSTKEPVEPEGDDEGYGNWTVPSWSELISSLYRPER